MHIRRIFGHGHYQLQHSRNRSADGRPILPLPTIIEPVIIDGTTQLNDGGAPVVEVDGSGAGAGVSGLHITAGSSTVKGMAIYNFTRHGILLETGDGNTVVGNYIGTDATGTASGKGNGNRRDDRRAGQRHLG
jgi:hypothetical protein